MRCAGVRFSANELTVTFFAPGGAELVALAFGEFEPRFGEVADAVRCGWKADVLAFEAINTVMFSTEPKAAALKTAGLRLNLHP